MKKILLTYGSSKGTTRDEFLANFKVDDDKIEGYLKMVGLPHTEKDIAQFKLDQDK